MDADVFIVRDDCMYCAFDVDAASYVVDDDATGLKVAAPASDIGGAMVDIGCSSDSS